MRSRSALAAAAAGVAAALIASTAGAAPGLQVRIAGVDAAGYPHLVLNVVTQSRVSRAPRLTEDGVPVTGFEAVNLGAAKSVLLAIDNSRSMGGASLPNATSAARDFVDHKPAADRIAVMSFGRRAAQLTSFSTSSADADGVLRSLAIDSRSGTALYDAVVGAAKALRSSQSAGRVIVLLTDGHDVSSNASLDQAVAAARSADASVYPIGIESKDFDPAALKALARATNGTYYGAGSTAALQKIYGTIAAELDRTWRLGYDTTARPGDSVRLRVSLAGAGSTERTVKVPVAFGTAPSAPPSGLLPSVAYSPLGTLVISLLVGGLALAPGLGLLRVRRGRWV